MPFRLGAGELLIILALVLLIFGGGRVASLGRELGSALREFQKGLRGDGEAEKNEEDKKTEPPAGQG